jgi:methylmalonyl-CoA epimerase
VIRGLHHIGIAVLNLDESIPVWLKATGGVLRRREIATQQKVEVALIEVGSLHIELLCPTGEDSPIAKFLASRGGGIHHFALECDSAQTELDRAAALGLRLISPTALPGAENTLVGFVHPQALGGVLLEFSERGSK